MVMFVIRKMEIDILLSKLKESYSNKLEKVWESGDMINAVFIQSELAFRTVSEQIITIIVQYYRNLRECEITNICSGGGDGLLRIDFGSELAAESTFQKFLENLARTRMWELSRKYPDQKGLGCPFCGAFYIYNHDKMQDDGSILCQNCNRSFILEREAKWEPHEERLV